MLRASLNKDKDSRGNVWIDRSGRERRVGWLCRFEEPIRGGGRRETPGKHSASTSARGSKRARGRGGRSAAGGAGFRVRRGARPLLRCARTRPDARASLAGRPPATSRPGPSPHTNPRACARTSTQQHDARRTCPCNVPAERAAPTRAMLDVGAPLAPRNLSATRGEGALKKDHPLSLRAPRAISFVSSLTGASRRFRWCNQIFDPARCRFVGRGRSRMEWFAVLYPAMLWLRLRRPL